MMNLKEMTFTELNSLLSDVRKELWVRFDERAAELAEAYAWKLEEGEEVERLGVTALRTLAGTYEVRCAGRPTEESQSALEAARLLVDLGNCKVGA